MKIYSPVKGYNGISANVQFVNGVGECETPHVIDWFKSKGYTVEGSSSESKPIVNESIILSEDGSIDVSKVTVTADNIELDETELEQKSKEELIAMLDEKGIKHSNRLSKKELIALLA